MMAICALDSLLIGLEELNDNVVDLDIAEQIEQDGNLLDAVFMLQKLALSTIGKAFTEDVLYKIAQACNKVLALDSTKKKVLDFIKNRMGCLAPNLIVVFGSVVSVKLVGAARSLLSPWK
ncbi:hypothetical protein BC332_13421 [Capsicum chinense]|nr:hypothetical protein BC332_13421 [Capsicum chinense]